MALSHLLLFACFLKAAIGAAPTFTTPAMAVSVPTNEDVGTGATVYTLVGADADSDPLTYAIVSQTPATPAFTLTGTELLAPAGLDADDGGTTSFVFVFSVSDGTDTVNSPAVTLTITDVADANPAFGRASYSACITDEAANGDPVITVTATADVRGDTITYSLTAGNTPDTFQIDSSTGAITVKDDTNVNSAITSAYTLTVTANDGTNSATVTVTVTVPVGSSAKPIICVTTWLAEMVLVLWLLRTIF